MLQMILLCFHRGAYAFCIIQNGNACLSLCIWIYLTNLAYLTKNLSDVRCRINTGPPHIIVNGETVLNRSNMHFTDNKYTMQDCHKIIIDSSKYN